MWREALLVHPSPERLDAYADRRLDGTARRRLTSHLARCGRCRRAVNATRRLAAQATAAPVRGFDADAILAGALARRAAGERVTAPDGPVRLAPESPRAGRLVRVGVPVAVAASLLLLASGSPALRRFMGHAGASSTLTSGDACASAARHEEEGMSFTRVLKVVVAGPVLAALGGCAEDRSVGAPVVTTFDGTRLKPATLVYEARNLVGETPSGDASRYTVRIDRATLDGIAAWVRALPVPNRVALRPNFVEHYSAGFGALDSIYYDARTLTPLRSAAWDGKGGRWVYVRRDGLVRLVEVPQWVMQLDTMQRGRANLRRLIMREMNEPAPTHRSPGATVGPAPLEMLTPGLPLSPTWRGALDVHPAPVNLARRTGVGGPTNALSLAVTGTRTVTTPAGTFDAWVLRGTAPSPRRDENPLAVELWVDRKDGWLLRQQSTRLDEDGDPWISEIVLQEVTPLP